MDIHQSNSGMKNTLIPFIKIQKEIVFTILYFAYLLTWWKRIFKIKWQYALFMFECYAWLLVDFRKEKQNAETFENHC